MTTITAKTMAALTIGAWMLAACGGEDAQNSSAAGLDGGSTTDAAGLTPDAGRPPAREDAGSSGVGMDASMPPNDFDASSADAQPPIQDASLLDADHGGPSGTYPAFTPDVPQLVRNGGPTLSNPILVTITWDSDADRATYERFGDDLGGSSYWHTAVGEYGVTGATSGAANHVHLPTAPATITDQQIQDMVTTNAGKNGWPAATDQIVYAFYLPATTKLMFGNTDACTTGVGGYHDNLPNPIGGKNVSYAVMLHCPKWTKDDLTAIASHEFGEAATDPYPSTTTPGPSLLGFDADHLDYEFFQEFQDENGDACEFFKASTYQEPAPFDFTLQKLWSNASAKAGHNPCVPVQAEPFYDVTTFMAEKETIDADLTSVGGGAAQSKGFKVAANQTKTFSVGYYSDAPTSGPWNLTAEFDPASPLTDMNDNPVDNGQLTISIDKPSGTNGEKAYVTVTVNKVGALGVEYFYLKSSLPGAAANHYLPILIGSK